MPEEVKSYARCGNCGSLCLQEQMKPVKIITTDAPERGVTYTTESFLCISCEVDIARRYDRAMYDAESLREESSMRAPMPSQPPQPQYIEEESGTRLTNQFVLRRRPTVVGPSTGGGSL